MISFELPSGWQTKKLTECLEKIIDYRGKSTPKDSTGYQLITARNVRFGYIDFEPKEYMNQTDYKEWMTRGFPTPGDVLFTTEAPLGNVALYPKEGTYALAQRLVTLRAKQGVLNATYLLYYLLSDFGQHQVNKKATGSTAIGIRQSELRKVPVILPPLPEQRKIAEILSTWDEAIAKTEQLIAALQRRKKGLMQHLLTGEVRFAGFDGAWKDMELGRFLKPTLRKVEKPKDGYLRLGVRSHGKGTFTSTMDTDDSEAVAMTHLFKVKEGDLIVSITFAWEGAIAIVGKGGDGALVSHRFPTYTFDTQKVLPEFFRYVMLSKRFFYDLVLISPGGAGRNRVMSKKDFLKLKIKVPSVEEQRKIGETLVITDEYINVLSKKLGLLQQQKKGLMQRLLTGQVRVKV